MSWIPIAQEPRIAVSFQVKGGQLERVTLENAQDFRLRVEGDSSVLEEIAAWCQAYATGRQTPFPLPLNWQSMAPFTRKSLEALCRVDFSKSLRYKDLATKLDNPRASRAVGNACARNPFPFVIPCHRVLASNGLGGFAFGLPMKQALLDFEASFAKK